MTHSLVTPNCHHNFKLDLSEYLGRGATANVYKVLIDGRDYALKIYKKPEQVDWSRVKAITELGCEDEFSFVKTHAWPMGIIQKGSQNIGFAMDLFDLDSFKTVDHYYDNILRKQITETHLLALPNLMLIAKNLSLEIAKFHKKNIFLVDVKPQNIAINTVTNEVIILDCDGFSFEKEGVRYPAGFVSPDYIAPEVTINKLSPTVLGLGQDLYALSVLIFQILNRGLHPYSGISKVDVEMHTNDDKATLGQYAYGNLENVTITPHVSSLHRHWEKNILSALENCFTAGARNSASRWVSIFESIERGKGYVRCDKFPQNALHIKFRDKNCMQCKLDGLQITHINPWSQHPEDNSQGPSYVASTKPPQPPPRQPQKMSGFSLFLIVSVLILILYAFLKNEPMDNANIDVKTSQKILTSKVDASMRFVKKTFSDGTYTGGMIGDDRNGQGIYEYSNGKKYVGEWKRDKINGRGFLFDWDGFDYCEYFDGRGYNCLEAEARAVEIALSTKFRSLQTYKRIKIQSKLKSQGFYGASLDGKWGRKTFIGIVQFSSKFLKTVELDYQTTNTLFDRLLR